MCNWCCCVFGAADDDDGLFDTRNLENLGENRVGTYRRVLFFLSEFRDYAFNIVVGHLFPKDSNVLQKSFNSFHGLVRRLALADHVLFETSRNFLLVVLDSVLFEGILQSSDGFLALDRKTTSSDDGAVAKQGTSGSGGDGNHCCCCCIVGLDNL
eukprot:CAMPEP_0197267752 /NCGR_PEP_ID=MMETSP1432-20130617/3771_1 /TAXON_ID=44447 /ORGANISM="Pseudo-nitzschia delicatissima, Strain UNC1205" /LENGTH=154 /DNA_ID=CAMNT_0042732731 /DNA_START=133 /DNA_END=597 /DNA_ORIENTATION=+